MKINVEDFEDYIRNNWELYNSEVIDFENFVRIYIFFNSNNEYKVVKTMEYVTKKYENDDVLYFGSDIEKAVETYNMYSRD